MLAASCRAPKMRRKPDAPFWRNAARCSRGARQRAPAWDVLLSSQPLGQALALRLDLSAQGRADEHVTVFAHERQAGTYQGHVVRGERLRPNADVHGAIATAPDFVGSVIPGQGLKGIIEAEPNFGNRAVMRMTRQECLEQRHRRRGLWLGRPELRNRASAHCGNDRVLGKGLEGFVEAGLGAPCSRSLATMDNRVTTQGDFTVQQEASVRPRDAPMRIRGAAGDKANLPRRYCLVTAPFRQRSCLRSPFMVALPVLQDGLCPILRVHEGQLGAVIGQRKEALCHRLLVQGIRLFNGRENMLQVRMRGGGGMAPHGTQLPCPEQGRCKRCTTTPGRDDKNVRILRSEERRVGKECRSRWSPY